MFEDNITEAYSAKDIQALLSKGKVTIQYPEPRSRGKVGGGDVKSVKGNSVIIRDKFTGDDMEVNVSDITMATNVK